VPGEIVVQFAIAASQSAVEHALRDVGGVDARKSETGGYYVLRLADGADEDAAVARLRGMPEVSWVERNGVARALLSPNDEFYRYQWNMKLIGAERTWDIQKGDPSVVVAVIDTGIAYEDFGPFRKAPDWGNTQFVTGFNVLTRSEHANDDNFHGTHVASTIAEATNNTTGVAGLCFQCALMPVKALNAAGSGSFVGIAEGIDYATNFMQNGRRVVKVINLSLGGEAESQAVREAIGRAVNAGHRRRRRGGQRKLRGAVPRLAAQRDRGGRGGRAQAARFVLELRPAAGRGGSGRRRGPRRRQRRLPRRRAAADLQPQRRAARDLHAVQLFLRRRHQPGDAPRGGAGRAADPPGHHRARGRAEGDRAERRGPRSPRAATTSTATG
jgi:hypothetical protein